MIAMYNTPELRDLWKYTLTQIREIEDEMKLFEDKLSDFGLSMAMDCSPGRIECTSMICIFGLDTTFDHIDDFEYVSNQLDHAKRNADKHIDDLNKCISKQAREDGINPSTMPLESVAELIRRWGRDVIGRYYNLAIGYLQVIPDDDDGSIGMKVFTAGVYIPKTFKECFPVLNLWNIERQESEWNEFEYPKMRVPSPRKLDTWWSTKTDRPCKKARREHSWEDVLV